MTYDRELRTEAAHALTHNQEVWSDRGYAVVTAGGLSAGSTDFELDVGPYDVLVGDTDETSVGPTTLSVNAPSSDPYWLVVYVDGEGLQTTTGPEGEVFVGDQSVAASNADVREITSPAPPTLADIGPVTVLGKVLVTSSGVSNSLIDDRTFGGGRIADSLAFRSLDGQIDTANLSDDAVTAAKLAANAVESGKIASGAVGVDELAAALGTDSTNPVPGTSHFEAVSADSATVTNGIDAGSVTTESLETNSITHLKENESLQGGIDRAHNDEIAILFVPPGTYSDDITLKDGVAIVGALGVNNQNDPAMRRFIDSRGISGEPPAVTMGTQTALIGFQIGSDGFDVVIETDSNQCRISDCVLQTGDGLEINGDENFVRFNEIRNGITDNGIGNQLVGNVT